MFQRISLPIRNIVASLGLVVTLVAGLPVKSVNAGPLDAPTTKALNVRLPAGLSTEDWNEVQSLLPATVIGEMQQAYIKASNTGDNDFFGDSISLSGDTLAVGSWDERSKATGVNGNQSDRSAYGSGAVYVFTRSGNTWAQQAYIKASNTEEGDGFGYSVSLSGDTLVVGAINESSNATGVDGNQADNSALYSGAVYVFTRNGTTWSQQAYIKASNTETYDNFGNSLSLAGDTLAVGANGEKSNATGINGDQTDNSTDASGAVYVFTRSGTTWSQQAYIKASNTDANDLFGESISLSGNTLIVGAYGEDSSAIGVDGDQSDNSSSSSGAVYIFARSGTTWSQQAYIKSSNPGSRDNFGRAVSLSENSLAVGAEGEDSNALGVNGDQADNSADYSGAVYVFTRNGATWSQQAYIKASNTETLDSFGTELSLSGDTLAVGATGEDSGASGVNGDQADNSVEVSGAVYLFTRHGTTWSQKDFLKASNPGEFDNFSRSLSFSGNTLAVGVPYEDSSTTGVNGDQTDNSSDNSGAAYVFTTGTLPTVSSTSLGVYVPVDTSSFTVRFSVPVADFGSGSGTHDVTNPANYLLVDRGANKKVDTKTCRAGVVGDDNRIDIQSVAYDNATQTTTINLSSPLSRGLYRLFVCGTTSIMDMAGNHLNGGIDSTYDFGAGMSIGSPSSGSSSSTIELPATGFAPGRISVLPDLPELAFYHASDTRLEIPALGVNEAVVGVPEESGWDVSWLGSNIGYLEGTAYPSLPGNSVLAAHVYNADGLPGPFIHLGELKYGDRLVVHTFGQNYRYEVREVQDWIPASDTRLVTRHEDLPWLTLVTCRGYNEKTSRYDWRTVVRAVLVDIES